MRWRSKIREDEEVGRDRICGRVARAPSETRSEPRGSCDGLESCSRTTLPVPVLPKLTMHPKRERDHLPRPRVNKTLLASRAPAHRWRNV